MTTVPIKYLEVVALAERLHRQFLDVIQLELDRCGIRDINNVQALILRNIGEAEMTVSELMWRGCYLGSNVSYNLRKLTEAGYVVQERSTFDRRVVMVRASDKGEQLCGVLKRMNERHISALAENELKSDDLDTCLQTLLSLQRFWGRALDSRGASVAI
jgi:DNA-binding MarR family transcriptional regulator